MRRILRFRKEDEDVFENIRKKKKRIETRAGSPNYLKISEGDMLIFVCGRKRFKRNISKIAKFKSASSLIKKLGFKTIDPDSENSTKLQEKILGFPNYQKRIKKYGILAFYLK